MKNVLTTSFLIFAIACFYPIGAAAQQTSTDQEASKTETGKRKTRNSQKAQTSRGVRTPNSQRSDRQQQAASPNKRRSARPTSFWPAGVAFDDKIPTPKVHFGFEIGFRHLSHAQIVSYMKAVAAASNRVTIEQTGTTHGGRPTLLLTITSPKNRKRLKQIQATHVKLASGSSEIDIPADLPAVINMGYGVHGDEPSATNCSPLVLHYLAAAKGKQIERILDNCVILLDPSLNPDGFNRFANWANRYRGRVPNPDPQHAEHSQQWPPGRVNYYWFDLNRDWLPLVHPESHARIAWYHAWKPNVVLDFHEMGTNSTFFFQPGIPQRTNPLTPEKNVELTNKFGAYHAKALDRRGSLYFTQERFDDFYMGKGSTYPDLHGAVGILFEQASSRGHVQKNIDGLLRFRDTIANQFTTSLSSLRATADLRMELLEFKKSFYTESLRLGEKAEQQTFVFSCPDNPTRLRNFATTLQRHNIQSYWLKNDTAYGDENLKAGEDLIVPAAQAEYRFLMSLLMTRKTFKENIFYDVSSWTLPLAYGLNQKTLKRELDADNLRPFDAKEQNRSPLQFSKEDVAYLVDWRNDRAVKLLNQLQRNNVKVRVALKPFTSAEGLEFPRGTLSIPLGTQKKKTAKIRQLLRQAANSGQKVYTTTSGLTPKGIDLGSGNFGVVKKAKIAMLTGRPVSAYNAGAIWHHLDTRIGLPVTMLKPNSWDSADLSEYTAVILPNGRYQLSKAEVENLRQFVRAGGTLIATGNSGAKLAESIGELKDLVVSVGKTETKKLAGNEELGSQNGTPKTDRGLAKKEDEPIQKPFDTSSTERALKLISGAIFKTKIDLTHPLNFGLQNETLPVFRSHTTFLKPSKNRYNNPIIYDLEAPLMAGYCSDENQAKAKGAASSVVYAVGRGHIVLLSEEPTFRGFWHATGRVLMNAIYFGDKM